jgi:hypothetical protein
VQFVQNLPDKRRIVFLTIDTDSEFSAKSQFVSPLTSLATSMATYSVLHGRKSHVRLEIEGKTLSF